MEVSNNNWENENKSNKENKKKIVLMVICAVILLILVIGSTYAYFSVDVKNSETPTNVTIQTGKIGEATLKSLVSDLYLNVSAQDMAMTNQNKSYYATPDESTGREESATDVYHNIAEVTIAGGEEETNYICSADVTITSSGDMTQAIYDSGNEEELVFSLKSDSLNKIIDFHDKGVVPQTVKWSFKIKGNGKAELQAYLKLENLEYEQDYLPGTNLQLDIETNNLSCKVYENTFKGGTGEELAKSSQLGLNNELVGDMYRFQGTLADNYLCFGKKCANESNDMYRIIGVTSNGLIKVIKQKSIGTKEWWTDSRTDKKWPESNLYNYLNTDENNFYDTLDEKIKGKIENHYWKYGDITTQDPEFQTGDMYNGFYKVEEKWSEEIQAHIGLMYLSDYIYSAGEEIFNKWIENQSFDTSSWIHMDNNGVLIDDDSNDEFEWTMSRYGHDGGSYYAWYVDSSGNVYLDYLNDTNAVRPVFYLQSTATITEGDGTPENPFIIN